MMNKNIMLLICAIVSISGYSQEKASVTQNPTTESRDSIDLFRTEKLQVGPSYCHSRLQERKL
jgi:hypothetical protein